MSKIRKFMIGFVFVLIVVMGVNTGSSDVKAASTKNFKGNLNVTYKNSEWKSKITIKKIDSKKVKINAVYDGYAKFSFIGKVTSKNSIKFTAVDSKEANVEVILKWKDKSHFTSKWEEKRSNGLKYCSDELVFVFDNAKYTQVKKSNTIYYYGANRANGEEGEFYSNNPLFEKAVIKGDKLILTGTLMGSKNKSKAFYQGKFYDYKKRTFKLTNKTKYYQMASEWNSEGKEKFKKSKKYAIKWCELCYGIRIKVINNKVEWVELFD